MMKLTPGVNFTNPLMQSTNVPAPCILYKIKVPLTFIDKIAPNFISVHSLKLCPTFMLCQYKKNSVILLAQKLLSQ